MAPQTPARPFFRRLFSPSTQDQPSSSKIHDDHLPNRSTPSGTGTNPELIIHVPIYGAVLMAPFPNPALRTDDGPELQGEDTVISGQLEVRMPPGSTKRCKKISVEVWGELLIDLDAEKRKDTRYKGKLREVEEDVTFRREVVIDGGEAGIELEEGSQRFEFTLILPADLPPHDFHRPIAQLRYDLRATVHGEEPLPYSSGPPGVVQRLGQVDELGGPRAPPESAESVFLRYTYTNKRMVLIAHNPNPTGGINELVDDFQDVYPGLGICDIRTRVKEFTLGCRFPVRLSLPALSPLVIVFAFDVTLYQNRKVVSQKDGESVSTTQNLPILKVGTRPPPPHDFPGSNFAALWRGTIAGGKDEGEYQSAEMGWMPVDTYARSSTLPGITTPIHNTHSVIYSLYYSVFGEYSDGRPLPRPNPGQLRLLKRTLPILLPSCGINTKILRLPSYSRTFVDGREFMNANAPCPQCGRRPHELMCSTCPPAAVPHLRHDLHIKYPDEKKAYPDEKKRPVPLTASNNIPNYSEEDQLDMDVFTACESCLTRALLPLDSARYLECICERRLEGLEGTDDPEERAQPDWIGGSQVSVSEMREAEVIRLRMEEEKRVAEGRSSRQFRDYSSRF